LWFYFLKYFHLLPAPPSYPPDIGAFVEKLVEEEVERQFSEELTANMHRCADMQDARACTTLQEVALVIKPCPFLGGMNWAQPSIPVDFTLSMQKLNRSHY